MLKRETLERRLVEVKAGLQRVERDIATKESELETLRGSHTMTRGAVQMLEEMLVAFDTAGEADASLKVGEGEQSMGPGPAIVPEAKN